MEDLGDIIYVVAMIIAVAYSAFRKAQKNKRTSPLPNEDRHPLDDSMDEEEPYIDDLRELFKPQAPKPVTEPVKEKPKTQPLFQQAQREKVVSKPIKVVDLETKQEEEPEFEQDQIDLRQAVIYSEILNRPYQ